MDNKCKFPGNPQVDRALEVAAGGNLVMRIVGSLEYIPLSLPKGHYYISSPCPCGHLGDVAFACHCTAEQIWGYRQGWAPDDIRIELTRPHFKDLPLPKMSGPCHTLLNQAYDKLPLTLRQVERVLKVASRIQSMEGDQELKPQHLAEAIQYQVVKV